MSGLSGLQLESMRIFVAALLLLITSTVFAHDLFLVAHPFRMEKPGSIQMAMNLAEAFPGEEQPWRKTKTLRFWLVGPGESHELTAEEGKNPTVNLSRKGTYMVAWNGSASYIEIPATEFNPYVESQGYRDVIAFRKHRGQENAPGKEKYTRFLKAIVQVGDQLTEQYAQTLDQQFEMVPLQNPYLLTPGSTLSVRVLFNRTPIAGIRVMATYDTYSKEHDVYAHRAETDANGIAKLPISAKGVWMIRANHMLPLEEDPKADWQSFWANFTFEVK
jgi:Domain of unknown function (DUF4198)